MAEAPEDNDVSDQVGENATDPVAAADVQQTQEPEETNNHHDAHQSQTRAVSSKKKKRKDKSTGVKKPDSEKSTVPMSNVKNLQELISKLSSMPSSLTGGLSETDGASKGHEFWDTQPVPKLGKAMFCHMSPWIG